MDIKITTNNSEILSNGSILISNNQDLIFEIADLKYILKFISNAKIVGQKIEFFNNDALKNMTLIFNNFDNILGVWNTEPINLGHINGKELFLNYRISREKNTPGSNQILFYYTWFLGNGANNVK